MPPSQLYTCRVTRRWLEDKGKEHNKTTTWKDSVGLCWFQFVLFCFCSFVCQCVRRSVGCYTKKRQRTHMAKWVTMVMTPEFSTLDRKYWSRASGHKPLIFFVFLIWRHHFVLSQGQHLLIAFPSIDTCTLWEKWDDIPMSNNHAHLHHAWNDIPLGKRMHHSIAQRCHFMKATKKRHTAPWYFLWVRTRGGERFVCFRNTCTEIALGSKHIFVTRTLQGHLITPFLFTRHFFCPRMKTQHPPKKSFHFDARQKEHELDVASGSECLTLHAVLSPQNTEAWICVPVGRDRENVAVTCCCRVMCFPLKFVWLVGGYLTGQDKGKKSKDYTYSWINYFLFVYKKEQSTRLLSTQVKQRFCETISRYLSAYTSSMSMNRDTSFVRHNTLQITTGQKIAASPASD